ncbi:MAG: UxaA family hydrolase [Desulfobacteraceae bacterium]|nr:UxaA family hydrolase [Desulfobacteraceae bacterium]
MKRAIMMNSEDNVATALEKLDEGSLIRVDSSSQENVKDVTAKQAISFGHKIAVIAIMKGDNVVKYGAVIGSASHNIEPGDYVHVHNVISNRMQMPEIWYR